MKNMMNELIGKYVIVRTVYAGVHAGVLKSISADGIVEMTDSRRVHYWNGAASLSQMGIDGIGDKETSRVAMALEYVMIREWIEIIPCTKEAEADLRNFPVWKR